MRILSGIFSLTICLLLTAETAFPSEYGRYGSYGRQGGRYSQEFLVINRPPNIQGLTGLMIMNTAFTQKTGHMAFGISALGENSDTPDYSIVQGVATLTMGITDNLEFGAKGKFIATDLGSSLTREQGFGDTEVALKWRIRNQSEEGTIPAIALGIGGIIPTGDSAKGFEEVRKQGLKFMVIASAENRVLDDSFVGIHFEGQAVLVDQIAGNAPPTQEMYGVVNAGLHFPFNENNHLQFMIEYNQVTKKDIPTLREGNYQAVSAGLRYVTKHFNITAGGQFLNKEQAGVDDTVRLVGTMSLNY